MTKTPTRRAGDPAICREPQIQVILERFGDCRFLVFDGNILTGVVDNTSEDYLYVPIDYKTLTRYEAGSKSEERSYRARFHGKFTSGASSAKDEFVLWDALERLGYFVVNPSQSDIRSHLPKVVTPPAIFETWIDEEGNLQQTCVSQKPETWMSLKRARDYILTTDESRRLFTVPQEVAKWWNCSDIKHLHSATEDIAFVSHLPFTGMVLDEVLHGLLTLENFRKYMQSPHIGVEYDPKAYDHRHPLGAWLYMLTDANPTVLSSSIELQCRTTHTRFVRQTPEWAREFIAKCEQLSNPNPTAKELLELL